MDSSFAHNDTKRASIRALLKPATIAIAGASSDPGKLVSLPLSFLIKHVYVGTIHADHPKLDQISGVRCYKPISEMKGEVDLLVVAVAAARIINLLGECRPGQVKGA